jgi:hypothetical protein
MNLTNNPITLCSQSVELFLPYAMTKNLPSENPLASRFHWTIGSDKTLIRLIFPVEILYSLLSDGI